jgi:hypothetical protein
MGVGGISSCSSDGSNLEPVGGADLVYRRRSCVWVPFCERAAIPLFGIFD